MTTPPTDARPAVQPSERLPPFGAAISSCRPFAIGAEAVEIVAKPLLDRGRPCLLRVGLPMPAGMVQGQTGARQMYLHALLLHLPDSR